MSRSRGVAGSVLVVALLSPASPSVSAAPQTFAGVITDSECDTGNHARMRMGNTDAECAKACVEAHGASYVLYDGTRTFALTDQTLPQRFAGRKVTVKGTLDAKTQTIHVDSITAR
jgi:hypothetical protein